MPSTYTGSGIELIADGEQSGTWGQTTNTNLQIINRMTSEFGVIALSGTTHTLTISDGTLSDGQYGALIFNGSPSGTNTVTISPNDAKRIFIVENTSGQTVIMTQGSGGNVSILDGDGAIVYCNGDGASAAVFDIGSTLRTTNNLIVANNLSDLANTTTARTNLGLGSIATQNSNSVTITGGTINGVIIGGSSTAAISGTTGNFSGDLTIADKIVHAGDTNTAIRFPAADTVTVETAGAERVRVTSAGDVGIGTGTPSSKLQVAGTVTATGYAGTVDGTNAVGFRNIPPVGTKTTSYTLQTADVGKYVQVGSGGSITVPNATFAEGDAVSIFNNTSGDITITCSITTAYIGGTNSDVASVTLATRGVANVLFISGTVAVLTGNIS